jgi:dihydropteroate synthase
MRTHWQTSRYSINLTHARVMGIVNVTPDSFSERGEHATAIAAIRRCEQLIEQGADILDIGGESTRPGAAPLPLQEELNRILPVVKAAVTMGVPVWALRWVEPGDDLRGSGVLAAHPSCGVCLMHMHREPQTMQLEPMAADAVPAVLSFLKHHTQALQGLGIEKSRICIDPGVGFGKTVDQNFALLARQREFLELGYPLLAGWSRKSSLAAVTQSSLSVVATLDAHDRMVPSVAAAVLAVNNGANIVRVHDVRETVSALRVWAAMDRNRA